MATGLHDSHPRLREHAIKLSERFLKTSSGLLAQLASLTADESEHVRCQLAYSLGVSADPQAIAGLARLAGHANSSSEVRTAILSSIKTADTP